jgi:hypothetical protein
MSFLQVDEKIFTYSSSQKTLVVGEDVVHDLVGRVDEGKQEEEEDSEYMSYPG